MIEIILILILIFTILFVFLRFRHRGKNYPPGPSGYPLIGNTTLFQPRAHEALAKLGKQHGNVFSLYFGRCMVVVLNDSEAIKEALVKHGDSFTGRPSAFLFEWYQHNTGIIFSKGRNWKEQRRFAIYTLRDFGFGRSSLEDRIMMEVQNSIDVITSHKGQPFYLNHLIDKAISNVICSLVFDKRFDYDDKQLERLLSLMEIIFGFFSMMNPVNFFPPIRFISKSFKVFEKAVYETRDFMNKIIDEHLATYQPESLRDLVDVYLKQMKEDEAKHVTDTTFTRDNLVKVIENFFNAGTDTSSTTLLWGLLYMMHYPHVQQKIQDELDHAVGSRSVSLTDRNNLPYTEAAIMEIQRLANLAPLSIFHMTENDVTLFNYFIPKDTVIIPNLWAAHRDTKYWPNPNEFKPERFLDEYGKVLKNPESFFPFSIGKRICPGESLAKNELFLFMANFLQRFTFAVPTGDSLPDLNNYIEGITLRPQPFRLCAKIR